MATRKRKATKKRATKRRRPKAKKRTTKRKRRGAPKARAAMRTATKLIASGKARSWSAALKKGWAKAKKK